MKYEYVTDEEFISEICPLLKDKIVREWLEDHNYVAVDREAMNKLAALDLEHKFNTVSYHAIEDVFLKHRMFKND